MTTDDDDGAHQSSSSAWRSPLSILMGARRNDDADLELRADDDYNYNRRPPTQPTTTRQSQLGAGSLQQPQQHSPPPATTMTTMTTMMTMTMTAPRTPAKEEAAASSSSSSYNPFGYFGLTSPVRLLASAAGVVARNDTNNAAGAGGTNNGDGGVTGGGGDGNDNNNPYAGEVNSPAPPLGAFPPPVDNNNPGDRRIDALQEEEGMPPADRDMEEEDGNDDDPFVSSHPWFNQLALTDPIDDHCRQRPGNSNDDEPSIGIHRERNSNGKGFLSWSDRRAIIGATFNFANSIIGAGAMGLGGAFAASGGGISVLCLIGFALLTKSSLDLVVDLSSCPSIIAKARPPEDEDRGRNGGGGDIDVVGSSFADSESLGSESMSDGEEESSAMLVKLQEGSQSSLDGIIDEVMQGYDNNKGENDQGDTGGIIEEAMEEYAKKPGDEKNQSSIVDAVMEGYMNKDADQTNRGGALSIDDATKDGKAAGEESSHKSTNDTSPLMDTREKGGSESNEMDDALFTPAKTAGLGMDHPLMQAPGPSGKRDRYDSLTIPATQPKYFSPLQLNTDGIPLVRSAPPPAARGDDEDDAPAVLQRLRGNSAVVSPCTYEELGRAAFGTAGRLSVLLSKASYSFGCLVAYVVVVRDNFGPALRRIVATTGPSSPDNLIEGEGDGEGGWLYDDDVLAFWISAIFMLPLSCPRTMKPLAKFSFVSVLSILFLVVTVAYLFFTCTTPEGAGGGGASAEAPSFYENWIEVRSLSGFVESLGCFVFTFVCHHTVNLAYESLPAPIRRPSVWRRVSTNSIALALQASLAIGVFAYLTFGSQTPADVLMGYPADLALANVARLLLCTTMVLTFPLPFLTCREMSVLILVDAHEFYHARDLGRRFGVLRHVRRLVAGAVSWVRAGIRRKRQNFRRTRAGLFESGEEEEDEEGEGLVQMQRPSFLTRWMSRRGPGRVNVVHPGDADDDGRFDEMDGVGGDVTESLLSEVERETDLITSIGGRRGKEINPSPLSSRSGDSSSTESTISFSRVPPPRWILPDGDGRQLSPLWHAALTFGLWLVVTSCAIKSPSLGDVLDLVGAFTGTLLAFILPALFAFKLKGYSHLSMAILAIGGVVGLVGTISSFIKFMEDIR